MRFTHKLEIFEIELELGAHFCWSFDSPEHSLHIYKADHRPRPSADF